MASRRWFFFFAMISCAVKLSSTTTNCSSDGGLIQPGDLATLMTWIQEDNLNPVVPDPFALAVQGYQSFWYQTCKICVENENKNSGPSGDAMVSLAEVATGSYAIYSLCSTSACQGGDTMITPNSGPSVNLAVHSPDYICDYERI